MTIDKAIEILTWENSQFPRSVNPDFTDALELGIEALKQFKNNRPEGYIPSWVLLPGETKD